MSVFGGVGAVVLWVNTTTPPPLALTHSLEPLFFARVSLGSLGGLYALPNLPCVHRKGNYIPQHAVSALPLAVCFYKSTVRKTHNINPLTPDKH